MRGSRLSGVLALLLIGCNALLGTDEGQEKEAPNDDASPSEDGGVAREKPDAEAPLGEPPADRECPKVYWSDEKKTESICQRRRIVTIEQPINVAGLAIERSLSGRVAIAYSIGIRAAPGPLARSGVDVVQFTDATDAKKRSTTTIGADLWFSSVGLAKWKQDGFLLAYHCLRCEEISVVELGSKGAEREAEVVASGLPSPTYLSLATNAAGNAHLAWLDPDNGTLSARGKKGTGSWSARTEIDNGFIVDGLAGSGQVSLVLDSAGTPHAGYHRASSKTSSAPSYKTVAAGQWGFRRGFDESNGEAGFSIAFGVFREARFAAYFARGRSDHERELRVKSWTGTTGSVALATLQEDIPIVEPLDPNTSVAMAVDAFGLVHLAAAYPVGNETEILYIRQTIVDGEKRWLWDRVDHRPWAKGASSAFVSIVVDDRSRPHIAYHVNSVLYYATIYDD